MKEIYDINNLPKPKRFKYPWDDLQKVGSYFEWDNIEDRGRIFASCPKNIKISTRTIDNKLHVIRIK